jgi:hypothetical protein
MSTTTTAARTYTPDSSHWYTVTGEPCYELPKKDGKGTKVPTLADARKLNLLPSVTTILKVLDKPALNDWRVEQGVLAVLTTPRLPGESDDVFVHRVLHVEEVQNQESRTARDRGTEIHAALEDYFSGRDVSPDLKPWIEPAAKAVLNYGERVTSEKLLVGDGYAGKTDLVQEGQSVWWIWDFKTTKSLPTKGAWLEHRLQLAAYAAALSKSMPGAIIRTANLYLSTIERGGFVICEHEPDWTTTYLGGFVPLVNYWCWAHNYKAAQ